MPHARTFPCTVSVDVSGFAAQVARRPEVISALVDYFHPASIAAIQFIGTDMLKLPLSVRSISGMLCEVNRFLLMGLIVRFVGSGGRGLVPKMF